MMSTNQPTAVRLWHPAATWIFVLTVVFAVVCPLDLRAQATTDADEFHVRLSEKETILDNTRGYFKLAESYT